MLEPLPSEKIPGLELRVRESHDDDDADRLRDEDEERRREDEEEKHSMPTVSLSPQLSTYGGEEVLHSDKLEAPLGQLRSSTANCSSPCVVSYELPALYPSVWHVADASAD